jgi:hypothetical protein
MPTLGGIEPQGLAQGVQDGVRRVPVAALFDPGEVFDADPRSLSEVGAAESRRTAPRVARQTEILRLDAVALRTDEVSEWASHGTSLGRPPEE